MMPDTVPMIDFKQKKVLKRVDYYRYLPACVHFLEKEQISCWCTFIYKRSHVEMHPWHLIEISLKSF